MSRGRIADLADRITRPTCGHRHCRLRVCVCKTREGPFSSVVICDTEACSRTPLARFKEMDIGSVEPLKFCAELCVYVHFLPRGSRAFKDACIGCCILYY